MDYLGLVQAAHDEQTIGSIAYRDLPLPGLEHLVPAEGQPTTSDHDEAPQ